MSQKELLISYRWNRFKELTN